MFLPRLAYLPCDLFATSIIVFLRPSSGTKLFQSYSISWANTTLQKEPSSSYSSRRSGGGILLLPQRKILLSTVIRLSKSNSKRPSSLERLPREGQDHPVAVLGRDDLLMGNIYFMFTSHSRNAHNLIASPGKQRRHPAAGFKSSILSVSGSWAVRRRSDWLLDIPSSILRR